MQIGESESPHPSKNSEFDAAAAVLLSTECRPRFKEDVDSLIHEQVQSQGNQLGKAEVPRVAAEAVQAAMESSVKSLSMTEPASRGEDEQLAQLVKECMRHVLKRHQDCDCKLGGRHFEGDGLHGHFDETAQQLFGVCNSLTVPRE